MITIALYNLKGGVGKTTAAVNLAHLCSMENHSTLLFDMDPQGSASFYLRAKPDAKLNVSRLVNGGDKLEKSIRGSDYPHLDILPGDMSYRNINKLLRKKKHPKRHLQKVFQRFSTGFDFLFVDCPSSISIEAENVFRASDLILLPLIPTILSMETKKSVYSFFRNRGFDETLILPFFSMVDRRKKLHRVIVENNLSEDPRILRSLIPFSSTIEKMGVSRRPCTVSTRSVGALAFRELWVEVKQKLQINKVSV